jgi:hypothetical protein
MLKHCHLEQFDELTVNCERSLYWDFSVVPPSK